MGFPYVERTRGQGALFDLPHTGALRPYVRPHMRALASSYFISTLLRQQLQTIDHAGDFRTSMRGQ